MTQMPNPIQPVTGAPTQTQQPKIQLGQGGSANPYNLPPDLINGMTQSQQLSGLLGQFEGARNTANQANEQRYQDILGGYKNLDQAYSQRTQSLLGELQGFGAAQQQALQQKFQQQGAGLTQNMINRGLYNSTAVESAQQGLSRQQQQQELQLNDMLQRQRMDFAARLTGEELGNRPQLLNFMERREDVGPTYQDVAGVAGAVGQSMAGIPDYQSALGYSGSGTGLNALNPSQPQAPNAGQSPAYSGVDLSAGTTQRTPISANFTAPSGGGGTTQARRGSMPSPADQQQPTQRQASSGGQASDLYGNPVPTGTGTPIPGAAASFASSAASGAAAGASGGGLKGWGGGGSRTTGGSGPEYSGSSSPTGTGTSMASGAASGAVSSSGADSFLNKYKNESGETIAPDGTKVPGDPSYKGAGVFLPGIPYPVSINSLSKADLQRAAPWGGSSSSAAALAAAFSRK